MIKIALFCAGGMSTSILVNKMKEEATKRGIEAEINAYPESTLEARVNEIDVALLGPQIRFMLDKATAICEPKGVPVVVINPVDYGMMKGDKALDTALELLNK